MRYPMTIQAIHSEENESKQEAQSEIKIYSTYNYDLFNNHYLNRKPQKRQLEKLRKSMREGNLLPIRPLLVTHSNDANFKFDIIDGSHRFLIARELGYKIYYMVVPLLELPMLINLNFAMSMWGNYVYLELYCKLVKEEYLKFQKFIEDFKLDVHEALPLTFE